MLETGTYVFEKPLGMRDLLPELEKKHQWIKQKTAEGMGQWGYQFLSTPTLEYYETVGKASAIDEERLFKLLDAEGRTVVLRPDMTVPIARVAASGLKNEPLPLRLAYMSPVFRKQEFEAGRPAEFEQIGVELIGDASLDADAEVIALMIHLFQSSGLESFNITIGHIGIVNALLEECAKEEQLVKRLRQRLYEKNDVGFREEIREAALSEEAKKRLHLFIETRHLQLNEALETLPLLFPGDKGTLFKKRLMDLIQILNFYGVMEVIDLDLTLVSHSDYYTGIVFEGYGGKSGFPIGSGGRYDELLAKFQRPAPATGFGLRLSLLAEAIHERTVEPNRECVIYSASNKEVALKTALNLRNAGRSVVLQDAAMVSDIEAFFLLFKAVHDYR
jgi:ATP phosphoribosyltransferase regulatory subunit